tara:strand:+ start:155 stop:520 length:366 start_codon:yes stop_codon:yes gene_type:complete
MSKPEGKWTQENFKIYHFDNPKIYEMFEHFALQIASKKSYFSAKCIFHRIRWETAMTGIDDDYKIDDGWISHYARLFMDKHPRHKNFFQTRTRRKSYHNQTQELPVDDVSKYLDFFKSQYH